MRDSVKEDCVKEFYVNIKQCTSNSLKRGTYRVLPYRQGGECADTSQVKYGINVF